MTIDLSNAKERTESVGRAEDLTEDERFLHPAKENRDVQPENQTDVKEDGPIREHGFVWDWRLLQESNLNEKLGMAFELLDMGLSEEAVERVLHVNLDSKEKRL